MSVADSEGAVHIRLRDRAAGVGLEREPLELPHGAEARKELLQALYVEAAREGAKEIGRAHV